MHHSTTAIITFTEFTEMGYFYKYKSSDQSMDLASYRIERLYHELLRVFGDFYASGTQDAEATKSLR